METISDGRDYHVHIGRIPIHNKCNTTNTKKNKKSRTSHKNITIPGLMIKPIKTSFRMFYSTKGRPEESTEYSQGGFRYN